VSPLLYRSSHDVSSNKQVRVTDAGPERKLREALLQGVLGAAQLPAEERNENAGAV